MRNVQTTPGDASAQRSRRHQPILSIRARLIVLALLAIVPLMLERVHSLERARAERAELVRSQLIDLARSGEGRSARSSIPCAPSSAFSPVLMRGCRSMRRTATVRSPS
jgi:hypothetical protein